MASSTLKKPASKKQATQMQREQEEIARIDAFLNDLYQTFFGNFANHYPQLQTDATRDIHSILKRLLATSILTRLNAESKAVNQAIRARFYARPKHGTQDFGFFINHLEVAFLNRPRLSTRQSKLLQEDTYTLYTIALALQETVFAIPRSIYSGIERISREIQESLILILMHIDTVRKAYGLSISELGDARTRLYREIAQVDGFVWFPLRSLSTAPLAADELARFFVGRSAAVDRFARHIVKNNGVTLVTGYRGVGKSTFVNAVEARVPDLEKLQEFQDQRRIVTVKVNLAKVSSVINVLRLCTRNLYHKFLVEEPQHAHTDLERLLNADERRLMRWAYVCATRKVDMQWSESVETIKNLEASLDLKPGDLLPKSFGGGILGALLPSLGAKTSREWNKRMEHSIALLDYDEDRAEEDIAVIIEKLAKPNQRRNYGFKLVFIFDEMDKVDDDVVVDLIKKLKNLFLSRHVVFILVTGKEFYYNWLKAQEQEDSMLSSYFSAVKMIPLFTSTETAELLKRLHLEEKTLSPQEEAFVRVIALHLTYQAKGLPREIVRIVGEIQEEVPESLQSYLTDGSNQRDVFQLYADLQEVLEGIVKDIPESDWKEQAERGLYNLMEYFFSQKTVSLLINSPAYFSLVPLNDYRVLIERLQLRLPAISVKDVTNPAGSSFLFSVATQENDIILSVSDAFYQLTGRVAVLSSEGSVKQHSNLSIQEIRDRLRQDNLLRWKEAFEALRQFENKTLPGELYEPLYEIFTSRQGTQNFNESLAIQFRHSATQYLKGNKFFFVLTSQQFPGEFINNETNGQLIGDFIKLVQQATADSEQMQGTAMLLALLKANKQAPLKQKKELSRRPLPKDILTDLVSTICLLAKDDILEDVLSNLDPSQDITEILQPLQRLSSLSQQRSRLIDLLIFLNFQNIEQGTLQTLLKGLLRNEDAQKEIWYLALKQKQQVLAQRVMQIILQQFVASNIGKDIVLAWLIRPDWNSSFEDPILRNLVASNRSYFLSLDLSSCSESCKNRMASILKETEPPLPLEPPPPSGSLFNPINLRPGGSQARQSASSMPSNLASSSNVSQSKTTSRSRNNWVKTLLILLCLIVFFAIPLDLPLNLTVGSYLMARFLELVYINAAIFGAIMVLLVFTETDGVVIATSIISLGIAVGCFLLQLFFFRLNYSVLGQIALSAPMGVLWGLIIAIVSSS